MPIEIIGEFVERLSHELITPYLAVARLSRVFLVISGFISFHIKL